MESFPRFLDSRTKPNMLNEVKGTLSEGVVENTCPIKGNRYKILIEVLQKLPRSGCMYLGGFPSLSHWTEYARAYLYSS